MENLGLSLKFSPRHIKREAKGLLVNNWSRALAVLCILLLALFMFVLIDQFLIIVLEDVTSMSSAESSQIPGTLIEMLKYAGTTQSKRNILFTLIVSLFYTLIISPLRLGITRWYQSVAICGDLKINQVFYYYRTNQLFKSSLMFSIFSAFIMLGVLIISLAPAAGCFGLAISYLDASATATQRSMALPLVAASAALLLVGLIVSLSVIARWFVAKYLYVSGDSYGVLQAFALSRSYTKGRVGEILALFISCVPMWLSCVFVFPLLYAVPMSMTIFAAAAQDIIDDATGGE